MMLNPPGRRGILPCHLLSFLLWLAVITGWLVSIFSVIEEMCLATACRDTASFTIFGLNLGWFGIAYFTLLLILLKLRKKLYLLNWLLNAMVFSGIGSEFRLLWIQKYIIGSWCPLCVTICFALFVVAIILLVEKVIIAKEEQTRLLQLFENKHLFWFMALVAAMMAAGFVIAAIGVQALT